MGNLALYCMYIKFKWQQSKFLKHLEKYLPLFELLLPLTGAFMLNTISISPKEDFDDTAPK